MTTTPTSESALHDATSTLPPEPPKAPATAKVAKPSKQQPKQQTPVGMKPKVEEISPWAFSGKTLGRSSRKHKSKPSSERRGLRQKQSLIPRGRDRYPNNEGQEFYRAGDVVDFHGRVIGYNPSLVMTPDVVDAAG